MIPTKRCWLLIALGIPVVAACAAAGAPWLGLLYDAVVLGAALVSGLQAADAGKLRVRRKFDPVLSVNVANRIDVTVENEGAEPLRGVLRDEPPPDFEATTREFPLRVAPGDVAEFHYWITPRERGSDFFRGTFVRVPGPLGLVERIWRLPSEQPVRVYPNVLALREFDLLRQRGHLRQMGIRRSRMRGLGMEFESLREYTEGDDFRKIDWKATARRGKLVVRNFEQERNQSVVLGIDVGRLMLAEVDGVRKLDHVLDAVLMLAHAAARAGDCVGILVYADTVRRSILPRKGRNTLGAIIEAVHDLEAEPVESDPARAFAYFASRWNRRSLLICFSDVEDEEQARSMAAALGPLSKRHLTLVARVADPRLFALAHAGVESRQDLYRRAAAQQLETERARAGSMLGGRGIHTLDAEPQELATALVSFYFGVKERGAL